MKKELFKFLFPKSELGNYFEKDDYIDSVLLLGIGLLGLIISIIEINYLFSIDPNHIKWFQVVANVVLFSSVFTILIYLPFNACSILNKYINKIARKYYLRKKKFRKLSQLPVKYRTVSVEKINSGIDIDRIKAVIVDNTNLKEELEYSKKSQKELILKIIDLEKQNIKNIKDLT
jgi:hypothetical protein